jgi:sterol desaturase/sphingolipid hydroxylase (fatty acid hydroxylase superfamily)
MGHAPPPRSPPVSNLLLYSIPGFLALIALELAWTRRAGVREGVRGYELRDTVASLTMGIGNVVISAFTTFGDILLWQFAYEHRVLDLGSAPAPIAVVVLFLGEDLCYYWFHRAHHEIRILWAAHVHHHSSQYFDLSTALRQPWFTPFTGPWFWLPLALIGFSPPAIVTAKAVSLLYQFWIHTEAVRKLPAPLEWLLNTPSHHRVHHGKNPEYIDRNHGGVLIVWDRLFGTFEPEHAAVRYGLTKDIDTFNPLRIASHELSDVLREVRAARSWSERARLVFGGPRDAA